MHMACKPDKLYQNGSDKLERVVVSNEELPTNLLIRLLTGLSLNQFVENVGLNAGHKYDFLYSEEAQS